MGSSKRKRKVKSLPRLNHKRLLRSPLGNKGTSSQVLSHKD